MSVRLDQFDRRKGLSRGKPLWVEALWYIVRTLIFLSPWPWPSAFKAFLLRLFCAKVGKGVVIKPRVHILFPWKLYIGDHAWIGEEVCILNFEKITIGSHCCISQRAFLCGGNHDYRDPAMSYRNAPITIEEGAWIGASSFVAAGVSVGKEAVITAGSVVVSDMPPAQVCSGHPCQPKRARWK